MPEKLTAYERLPGRGGALIGVTRLWLAPDHLLRATTYGGFESYRRYLLRDIQALTIRRTAMRLVWNLIFGGVGGGLLAIAFAFWWAARGGQAESGTAYLVSAGVFGAAAAICFALLIVNTVRGQCCALHVQTAAGVEKLGAPARLRAARALITRLSPLIESAQAEAVARAATTAPVAANSNT